MAATCQACTATTGDGAQLCRDCTDELAVDLTSVSWLVTELETALTRQSRFTRQTNGPRSSVTVLPWDDRASKAAHELTAVLLTWARNVSSVDKDTRDPFSGVQTSSEPLARWLRRKLVIIRGLPKGQAKAAHQQIRSAVRNARNTVDRPPQLVTYGLCGNTDADETGKPTRVACDAYLYAPPGGLTIKCRKCAAVWTVAQRREWMLEYVSKMMGTASEISAYLGLAGMNITGDAVRALARRRPQLVPKVSTTASGYPIYRFSDVIHAVSVKYKRGPKPR